MKDNNYTAGQIREMLDLSRSAIRYYVKKGLISVDKNDENGYQSFDQKNLSDLRDISYLRQMLGFGIKDIQYCFSAASLEEYEILFKAKSLELEGEIKQQQIQLKRLKKWEYYLNYLKEYPDSIRIVEFPQAFVFSSIHPMEIDDIPFLCTSFDMENQEIRFNSYGYCINELALSDLDYLNGTRYHFPAGEYIYSMFSSELDMNNPDLVKPVFDWAKKQNIEVKTPILVDYFFRIKSQENYCYYYAVTIPLSDCDIRIEDL